MLSLLDPAEVRRDAALLVGFARPARAADEPAPEDPAAAYFAALNRVQERPFPPPPPGGAPQLDFDLSEPLNLALARHFLGTDEIDQRHAFPAAEREGIRAGVAAGFEILRRRKAPAVEAIELLVARLLCVKQSGAGGGSFGDSLGVVWLDPSPAWESVEYAETLLHEATHQAVFLRDMVRRLFRYEPREMRAEEALVTSAIRASRRPYDLAFHSACVAASLIELYARSATARRARGLGERLAPTLSELRRKGHLLAPAGLELLAELETLVAERAGPP